VVLPKYAMLGTLIPVVCVGTVDNGDGLACQPNSEPEKVRAAEEKLIGLLGGWLVKLTRENRMNLPNLLPK